MIINHGVIDVTRLVFIQDPVSTSGAGKAGLANTAMRVRYTRVEDDNDVIVTSVTLTTAVAALTDPHSDWGWKEVDATNQPGLYRLDIADAVFAVGAKQAIVYLMINATADAPSVMNFDLGTPDVNAVLGEGETLLTAAEIAVATRTEIDSNSTQLAAILTDTTEIGTAGAGLTALASQASVITLTSYVDTEVNSILTAVDTEVGAIKAKTDLLPASPAAVGDAMTLTSAERTAIANSQLDQANGVETSVTMRQALRAIAAAAVGVISGAGTAAIHIKAANNPGTERILTSSSDTDGNRPSITLTL